MMENKHKEELEWIHRVLRYIDDEEDFSYSRFRYLLEHGGWCPDCERVDDGECGHLYRGRLLQNPNEDGDYECFRCNERKEWEVSA